MSFSLHDWWDKGKLISQVHLKDHLPSLYNNFDLRLVVVGIFETGPEQLRPRASK